MRPKQHKWIFPCVAPLTDYDGTDAPLCGVTPTVTRVVEGYECELCAAHAAELDADPDLIDPWLYNRSRNH